MFGQLKEHARYAGASLDKRSIFQSRLLRLDLRTFTEVAALSDLDLFLLRALISLAFCWYSRFS